MKKDPRKILIFVELISKVFLLNKILKETRLFFFIFVYHLHHIKFAAYNDEGVGGGNDEEQYNEYDDDEEEVVMNITVMVAQLS